MITRFLCFALFLLSFLALVPAPTVAEAPVVNPFVDPTPSPEPSPSPSPTPDPTRTPLPPSLEEVRRPPAAESERPIIGPSGAPIRVGFVDVELVLSSSRAIRNIMGEIDSELAADSESIDRKRVEASRLQASLERQDALLAESERLRRQQQVISLMAEIDEMEYRFRRKVQDHQRITIEPLLEEVIFMIGEVGTRDGYDLIVRGEMVLYGRTTADLTPAVIRELDSREDELRRKLLQPDDRGTDQPSSSRDSAPIPLIP